MSIFKTISFCRDVLKPWAFNFLGGFILASILIFIITLFTGFPYKPVPLALGCFLGSLFTFFWKLSDWQRKWSNEGAPL